MKTKTLTLNLLAAALLLSAGAANAGSQMPLANAIRAQMHDAGDRINADIRANLKAAPFVLDVPGVEVGDVKLVDNAVPAKAPQAMLDTTDAGISEALRRDLVNKALAVPGMFGVYRYMAASALTVAIIVAE